MTNKEAIDILNNKLNIAYFSSEDNEALDLAIKALEDRPTGNWKYNPDCVNDEAQAVYYCSNCNQGADSTLSNYCPNCGAKMEMTNKEAIEDIKNNILPIVGGKSLVMAIKALEEQERPIGGRIVPDVLQGWKYEE